MPALNNDESSQLAAARARKLWRFASLISGLLLACGMPRDPENTGARVREGIMRVGVSENPPWVTHYGREVRGAEAELVLDLANRLGSKVEWVQGAESELLESLERFELDMVIGGLKADTPYGSRVGLSRSYLTTHVRVGYPHGTHFGEGAARFTRGRSRGRPGGQRVGIQRSGANSGPRVGQLLWPSRGDAMAARGLGLWAGWAGAGGGGSGVAVPPGENGWLLTVNTYLAGLSEVELMRRLTEASRL